MDTNSSFIPQNQTCKHLTLAEIGLATNEFDERLVVGRGGFGKVYKSLSKFGSLNDVAIKRLHSTSSQGKHEFEAEVKILCNLRHGNLMPLIGYCNEGNEMILAYEFMPNGTLEDHLHRGVTELSWLRRLQICVGAARGLDYLHTGTSTQFGVIHRDVKTSNIMLDSNFAAKISDFGLAKVGIINQTRTHVSTLVKGTFGYMDPCYFHSGQLTRKSDVYAFGVFLFEVLTGKRAVDPTLDEDQLSLAVWAQERIKEGRLNGIIDPRLMGQISKICLKEFASIAAHCLHDQPKQRPTMAEVVVRLDSILSREREHACSGVDDGRFINKIRYFLLGKAEYIHKSNNKSLRTFTHAELLCATSNCNDEEFSIDSIETIYEGWVHELTYAPTEPGVGLAMYVRTRHTGISELDLKPEEFNHPNLVKLLGYCLNNKKLSCVYQLIPGMSLDEILFGEPRTSSLSWVARLKVAVGAAQGLSFLHKKGHPAYSQFKTTCILVDMAGNARLRDFEVNDSFLALDSYSFEKGAHYAAPEWFRYQADVKLEGIIGGPFEYSFAIKSEIYSFGVVLLEILSGKKVFDWNRPEGMRNLVKWAIPLLAHEVDFVKILDKQLLHNNHLPKRAFMLAELVSFCLRPTRPSMEYILQILHECYYEAL